MQSNMPIFLAGPILRRTTKDEITLWAVTSRPLDASFSLFKAKSKAKIYSQSFDIQKQIKLGDHCFVVLAHFENDRGFDIDIPLEYDIEQEGASLLASIDGLLYPQETRPTFIISSRAHNIAHGSCRHPHQDCKDALVALDKKYASLPVQNRADLLIMSGDQIYADDVCGPLIYAIRQTITLLGLKEQTFDDPVITCCSDLHPDNTPLYGRTNRLPSSTINHGWLKRQLNSPASAIFTSNTTENHLVSFNEFIAMYILVWSPSLWAHIDLPESSHFPEFTQERRHLWDTEKEQLGRFCSGLPFVRRLFAHIPTYMILDDHDITDDFNLTVGWERAVFNSPFAQNIISNALLGYFFCQGWGNAPRAFKDTFWDVVHEFLASPSSETIKPLTHIFHHFECWHYTIPTTPKVVVIDTRTRRWRSESSYNKPSGLMDWESLMDFQEDVFNNEAVIVVSPAPMFGVKFIETLQRIVTFFGQPLATDSENWMAHPGAANALLNIFKHPKTPKNFVILSGDVHYSFAYDISLRFRKGSPNIWQITCSGFKNTFPEPYLSIFEWFDRTLFWPESPLNIFTRRKRMRISRRKTDTGSPQLLLNQSAVGEVILCADGSPSYIGLLTGEGEHVKFLSCEEDEKERHLSQEDLLTRD